MLIDMLELLRYFYRDVGFADLVLKVLKVAIMLIPVTAILIIQCLVGAKAREVVFPPVAGADSFAEQVQSPLSDLDEVDIVSGSQFSGLMTYARLPYTNCFADEGEVEKYDIAILGAPFDTVGIFKSSSRLLIRFLDAIIDLFYTKRISLTCILFFVPYCILSLCAWRSMIAQDTSAPSTSPALRCLVAG